MSNQQTENSAALGQSASNALLEPLRNQVMVQGYDGNWNYDEYMRGMYNGLECALATLEGRDPEYKHAPAEYLRDKTTQEPLESVDGYNNK